LLLCSFTNENLTWARESDSPQTLRNKFAALEELERQLGLSALWQHARVKEEAHQSDGYFAEEEEEDDEDNDDDEILFKRAAVKQQKNVISFFEKESDIRDPFDTGNRNCENENVFNNRQNPDNHFEFSPTVKDDEFDVYSSDSFFDSDSSFVESPIKRSVKKRTTSSTTTSTNNNTSNSTITTIIKPKITFKYSKMKTFFSLTFFRKNINLNDPTFIRIPSNPIPSTWCPTIHNPLRLNSKKCLEVESPDLLRGDDWISAIRGQSVLAAYINPPSTGSLTLSQVVSKLAVILPQIFTYKCGYLFIWTPRAEMATLLREADQKLGFKYVENLCWIRKGLDNRIRQDASTNGILAESKQTLLILKKDPTSQIKLRHQRNPDCIFDYGVQGRKPDARVYDVIETLIKPCNEHSTEPYLIHLWADSNPTDRLVLQFRSNWIRVFETTSTEDDNSLSSSSSCLSNESFYEFINSDPQGFV
jgi:hypothetical protein